MRARPNIPSCELSQEPVEFQLRWSITHSRSRSQQLKVPARYWSSCLPIVHRVVKFTRYIAMCMTSSENIGEMDYRGFYRSFIDYPTVGIWSDVYLFVIRDQGGISTIEYHVCGITLFRKCNCITTISRKWVHQLMHRPSSQISPTSSFLPT